MIRHSGIAIACAGLLLSGLVILYWFDPTRVAFIPPCPVYKITGYYCPGCGSLRALHRLFHGDVTGALAMNPLMVVSLPFIGALLFKPAWSYKKWVPWFCFYTLILYGVIRNIPAAPFTWLAPH